MYAKTCNWWASFMPFNNVSIRAVIWLTAATFASLC